MASPDPIKLVITARRLNVLEEIKSEIESKYKGTKVYPLKLDVSNPEDVRGIVGKLPEEVKDVDILVNNAYVSLVSGTDKQWISEGYGKCR